MHQVFQSLTWIGAIPCVLCLSNKHTPSTSTPIEGNESGIWVRISSAVLAAIMPICLAVAYFTEDTVHRLQSIDDIPRLASLTVPAGQYISARSAKGRPDHGYSPESEGSGFTHLEYVPYAPFQAPPASPPEQLSIVNQSHYPSSMGWHNPSVNQGQRTSCIRPLSQSSSSSQATEGNKAHSQGLVPLSYLKDQPPPRRHPNDEKVLMMLTSRCFQDRQTWLHSSLGTRSGAVSRWITIQTRIQ